jgi:hypothetical protein
MNPLHHLSTVELEQWPELYRSAVAAGSGHMLDADAERVAAPDELVAVTLPALVRLGAFALLADGASDPPCECATALGRESAGVLRLLDRALAAHARDNGYAVLAWLEHAYRAAHATAGAVSGLDADELPLSTIVEATAEAAASVVIALHRDRLGVPEALAEGFGLILVVRVAATAEGG